MHLVDFLIFFLYLIGVMSIGIFFYRRNLTTDDYYVGGRRMSPSHVGLSVVATDVGGGFSIGLGGLGYLMGLSGSWLLFTGLLGAWITAVTVIPRVKALDLRHRLRTYPDFLRLRFGNKVALTAALISGIGYMGFTGGQILAGAKLASVTLITRAPLGLEPLDFALLLIAVFTVLYTVLGGLKAVIYTDTVQWIILLGGLIGLCIPITLWKLGGWAGLREALPAEYFRLDNVDFVTIVNWMVTILPIWLIGMPLYQRIYACRDTKDAQRAWFVAGFFEYPVMAFSGVFLGMASRVLFPGVESELGLPMLIQHLLPVGAAGLVVAAYFSAIMSTADSCLMASSGNLVNDLLQRTVLRNSDERRMIRVSQIATLSIGALAVLLASRFERVLDIVLHAYGFMVAGLFIPTLGAYFWRWATPRAALASMLLGGGTALILQTNLARLPASIAEWGLDDGIYGMLVSAVVLVLVSAVEGRRVSGREGDTGDTGRASKMEHDLQAAGGGPGSRGADDSPPAGK